MSFSFAAEDGLKLTCSLPGQRVVPRRPNTNPGARSFRRRIHLRVLPGGRFLGLFQYGLLHSGHRFGSPAILGTHW